MAIDTVTDLQLEVRKLNNQQPWLWLQQGFADFLRAFPVSISYGIVLVLLSMGVTAGLYAANAMAWLLPAIGGFFLVAPLLATGFYGCSRALEENRIPVFKDAFDAFQTNLPQIILMGVELIILYIAWIRVALLVFALFYGTYPPGSAQAFYGMLLTTFNGWMFLAVGTIVGFLFALAAFALSVVAIPMLIEHKVSVLEANMHSLKAFAANPWPMMLWAALIVIFMIAGLVTFYLGLAIVFPVIGHATWHVYRDVIAH